MCGVLIRQTLKFTEEDKADGLFLEQQQCSAEMWFTSAVQLALQKNSYHPSKSQWWKNVFIEICLEKLPQDTKCQL